LRWRNKYDFEKGLEITIQWYMNNQGWLDRIRSGEYKSWLEKNYSLR